MFNFSKWQQWLAQRAALSAAEGFKAEFKLGPPESPKPAMGFGIIGVKAMCSFESWITGEVDWTIMAPPSADAKMVSHKWMLLATDDTFEAIFNEFMAEFQRYENSSLS
jgi:hypothetical protein